MVAADHRLASTAGVEIMRRGGNAVDAACATAFALGVVNPAGSGIGGGGFMLIKRPTDATPIVLDFRESAPAAASRDMYIKTGLPRDASRVGGLAVGVPGEVAGCEEAVRRYGKLSLRRVLAPAIRLARRGFPAGGHLVKGIKHKRREILARPGLAADFAPGGKPLTLGQQVRRRKLGRTLAAIARGGAKVFYRGWIAKDIVATVKAQGGVITGEDLAGYKVKQRTALVTEYRGHKVFTMPPPSSGGIAMIQTLNIIRRWHLRKLGHNSSRYVHLLSEALKHAFADRARYLGDTDFVKVPLARLVSRGYADRLAKRIGRGVAPIDSYGSPAPPKAPPRDSGTSHLSVIDKDGTAVAMTTTINTGFGSMVVGRRSGIILNNEMDDFAARPGKPNAYGLIQSENNAVAPHKRPLSSMSPTIVTKDGKARLVVGGSGGPFIITATLQTLINVVDFRLHVRDAVSRSRIHHQWRPNKLFVEPDLPADVGGALRKRGQKLKLMRHPFSAVQAVHVDKAGLLYGASDPRKEGAPAGL